VVLELGAPRQRAVLALLLAGAGDTVLLSRIVESVWGREPPRYAVNVVHKHVGAIRRVVEPGLAPRAQGRWLRSAARGYRVAVNGETLDLLEFRELAALARAAGDPGERLNLFEAALGLWRGPVAEDIAGEFEAEPVVEAITREHAEAVIQAAGGALALGQAGRVLPALSLAVRLNPADETVRALHVRCLASTGQRAAALESFESLRRWLADQLGISPGPVLAGAHLDVLRDRPARCQSLGTTPVQSARSLGRWSKGNAAVLGNWQPTEEPGSGA
jgi:DNA-binding SARP family transcriptional activator